MEDENIYHEFIQEKSGYSVGGGARSFLLKLLRGTGGQKRSTLTLSSTQLQHCGAHRTGALPASAG